MKFIGKTTWEDVFGVWRDQESSNPGWIHCATEVKGWPDWESWRRYSASRIGAENREWSLYEFTDPLNEIPAMLVGPFRGWQSRLPQKNTATFENLLAIPDQMRAFLGHEAVLSIMNGLPFPTQFMGIIREDVDKVVCLDGHHRATAFALAKKLGKKLDFEGVSVKIALSTLPETETYLLNELLERGSSENPDK